MKQKGFTLNEFMIGLVFVGVLITIVINVLGAMNGQSTISYGINGMTEMRCIDGYKFIIGQEGHTRQVMDEFGKGVKCQ